jgi:sugar lactone lactonase YvrE
VRLPLVFLLSLAVVLVLGAGPAAAQSLNISTIAGPGTAGTSGDGGPASQAFVGAPVGLTALPDGGYLIAHQADPAIRRVSPDGTITTIAGTGVAGYSGDGGPATQAAFDAPSAVVTTPDGGYLIADANNNAVRRVAPNGTVSVAAGMPPGSGFSGDGGPATSALIAFPYDIAVLPDGSFLIADSDNQRIRRVDATTGQISTVAGGGSVLGDGGLATAAQLQKPSGVAATSDGGYLIADSDHNRVRKVAPDGTISTVAGNGTAGETGDGGPAIGAEINRPIRAVPEPDGGFAITDDTGARVRRVAPDGTISTVAGTTAGFGGDGGPATSAQLNRPLGLAVLASGDIIVADTANSRVRLVDEDTPAPTLTGTSPASPAADNNPRVLGSAPAGTAVALFTDPTCAGQSVAGGTAADLAGAGIPVAVPTDSTTTFHAVSIDAGGNRSACSTSSVTYVNAVATALPPPVRGKLVNVVPVKGKVLVKVPGKGFVPLGSLGRQLPVGSTIDTTKGTVRLTSAKNAGGATQFGRFSRGVFKFTQTKKNPLTTISMTGGGLNACSKLPPGGSAKVVAAKKRRRTLFSDVKGRFRTRGRNSAATVRGTSWTMTDTCKGTITAVKTGRVEVRDFRLRKTKLVRAGHTYIALAPLRKKPRR